MTFKARQPGRLAVAGAVARAVAGAVAGAAVATLTLTLMPAPAHAAAGPDSFAGTEPARQAYVEIDLFRAFTDCLAEAAHGDSMYPGIDPAEVNRCLADYGF